VFFDEETAEYVVYFPERLKTGAPDGGRMLIFRFQPQFIVEPDVRVATSRSEDGTISYVYGIANQVSARGSIRSFDLVVPAVETPIKMDHPTWRSTLLKIPGQPVAPQAALMENDELRDPSKMGRFLSWTCSDTAPLSTLDLA
jgi:hypothetical protein